MAIVQHNGLMGHSYADDTIWIWKIVGIPVKKLARSFFYQLRQLRTVCRSLTTDATMTLVHTLISSCMDYC